MNSEVTVILEVYNEENRIENCLKCFQWADEIIVFDKYSTDNTESIALKYNARVIKVPYSEASENTVDNYSNIKTKEWILFITCSSMMHPRLAKKIVKLTSDPDFEFDVIGLPYKMYSLGFNSAYSPWHTEYKFSLMRNSVMRISDKLHEEIQYNSAKIYKIEVLNEDEAFYHFTNLSLDDFLQRTIRYTKYEAKFSIKIKEGYFQIFWKVIKAVLVSLKRRVFLLGWNGVGLFFAYVLYFLLKYLYFWELKSGFNLKSKKIIDNLIALNENER
jgi:glycosyltransferase involved in cell wall biosynthesis